jgi:hypothetical protein
MPVETLLPAWRGNKINVEVRAHEERSDRAFQDTAVEPWIQKGDCEREAKGSFEREGIGYYVWGEDVGIDSSQRAHKRLRASRRLNRNQERG